MITRRRILKLFGLAPIALTIPLPVKAKPRIFYATEAIAIPIPLVNHNGPVYGLETVGFAVLDNVKILELKYD